MSDFTISGWNLAGLFNISLEGFIFGYFGAWTFAATFFFLGAAGLRMVSETLVERRLSEIWLCFLTTFKIFSGFFDWQLLMI